MRRKWMAVVLAAVVAVGAIAVPDRSMVVWAAEQEEITEQSEGLSVEYESGVTVEPGADTTLTVNATTTNGELSYQWYDSEGNEIEGATEAEYTVTNITENTNYTCTVSDDNTTESASFFITINSRLSVEYDSEVTVELGADTTLTVSATTNIGELSYQWYDSEGNEIEGATEAEYTVTNITEYTSYTCMVSDGYSGFSAIFFINVNSGLSVEYDSEVTVELGADTTLAVSATTDAGELSYQWYDSERNEIEGATGAEYMVTNTTEYTEYVCKVSDGYSVKWVYFYIYVDSGLRVDYESEVKVQPGADATLTVNATTTNGELSYQWYEWDDLQMQEIEGATGAEYTVTDVKRNAHYCCEVNDGHSTESAYFSIIVDSGLSIDYEDEVTVEMGADTTLKVNATVNSGELSYQWYDWDMQEIEGATDAEYRVTNITDSTYYSCKVSDSYNNEEWADFSIHINSGLTVITDTVVEVGEDGTATLSIAASTNYGELAYKWYRRGEYRWDLLSENTSELTLTDINETALYCCDVSDMYNSKRVYILVGPAGIRDMAATDFESARVIETDIPQTAVILAPENFMYFKFVPKLSGIYSIASSGYYDTYAYLYDGNRTLLSENDSNDVDDNFTITYQLKAGNTYYIAAKLYLTSMVGSFPVTVTCVQASDEETIHTHTWDNGKITTPATCTATGVKTYTCTGCKETKKEIIPATGHSFGEWQTISEATVFEAEQQTRTCAVCKKTETRSHGTKLNGEMKLSASSLTLQKKQSTTVLKVSGMANGDYVKSVTCDKTSVLKVKSYKKTGAITLKAQKKTGTAKVTITLASGVKKTVKVKVQSQIVKTKKISGLSKKITVKKGESVKLAPVITPLTSQQKITYATSNKKVATVSSKGVIKAKKKGTAKITVKSGSKKFVVKVTVK